MEAVSKTAKLIQANMRLSFCIWKNGTRARAADQQRADDEQVGQQVNPAQWEEEDGPERGHERDKEAQSEVPPTVA